MPPSTPKIPVIIGVADILSNRTLSTSPSSCKEPLALMHEAILSALSDATQSPSPASSSRLQAAIDSIDVVRTWTWPYEDLPGKLGDRLGLEGSGGEWEGIRELGGK